MAQARKQRAAPGQRGGQRSAPGGQRGGKRPQNPLVPRAVPCLPAGPPAPNPAPAAPRHWPLFTNTAQGRGGAAGTRAGGVGEAAGSGGRHQQRGARSWCERAGPAAGKDWTPCFWNCQFSQPLLWGLHAKHLRPFKVEACEAASVWKGAREERRPRAWAKNDSWALLPFSPFYFYFFNSKRGPAKQVKCSPPPPPRFALNPHPKASLQNALWPREQTKTKARIKNSSSRNGENPGEVRATGWIP